MKHQVGKVKETTKDLPNHSHAYGKKIEKDEHNAAVLLTSWN